MQEVRGSNPRSSTDQFRAINSNSCRSIRFGDTVHIFDSFLSIPLDKNPQVIGMIKGQGRQETSCIAGKRQAESL